MRDRDLYAQILGIGAPWTVTHVELDTPGAKVEVHVRNTASRLPCPECGQLCPRHDHRERRWRHLDTCQFQTFLVADVPRVRCGTHGVKQIDVPWAEPGSSLTALFESLVIDWLLEASVQAVARETGRVLGYGRLGTTVQRLMEAGIEHLLATGRATREDDQIVIA